MEKQTSLGKNLGKMEKFRQYYIEEFSTIFSNASSFSLDLKGRRIKTQQNFESKEKDENLKHFSPFQTSGFEAINKCLLLVLTYSFVFEANSWCSMKNLEYVWKLFFYFPPQNYIVIRL